MNFLNKQRTQGAVSNFCSTQGISWSFIPEHAPHFGGLWKAAVKSLKKHLKHIVAGVKLTFEEFTTVLCQVEACLSNRPLISTGCNEDGIEALNPGHFLIGRPLEALPDSVSSNRSLTLLRRWHLWHLWQALIRHFWRCWSTEYLSSLQKFAKWHYRTANLHVDNVVVLREDGMTPTKWPLAQVIKVHPGKDGIVCVVEVKTNSGWYTRPVTKVARLLPMEQ